MGEEEIAEDGDETTQSRKGLIIGGGERGANAGGRCRTTGSGDVKTDKDEYGYERTSENEGGYKGTAEEKKLKNYCEIILIMQYNFLYCLYYYQSLAYIDLIY